ncbi:IclR family transcriptional regulator [Aliisedimentitalea sp. MJ-SS2]|uniref:IclR family transcriptional regulator n=1 Tax=Aliisedimentitalea sp. MJ-SS2 TaxID=3049795 RepID=UPI00292ECD85|nr:IclR family transcriptional regulator [Alisedimentitalea sp. MJ-SS2]
MGTITKALELLDFFSRSSPEIGLGEFVRRSGREKATVHRHLVELEQNGFVEKNPQSRAYRLGPAILRLSNVRETTHPARRLIRPVVTQLANDVGEMAHASLLHGNQLSPVFHFDPQRHGTQVHYDEAELLPLHATSSGFAVMAYSAPDFVAQVLSIAPKTYTRQTVTNPTELQLILERTRAAGIAEANQTFDNEVTSQSAAIFDSSGQPIGAISVAVPMVRATPDKKARIRSTLAQAALSVTRSLGGVLPVNHPMCTPT